MVTVVVNHLSDGHIRSTGIDMLGANRRLFQGRLETWKFAATKAFESEANNVQDWLAQFRFQSLPSASS